MEGLYEWSILQSEYFAEFEFARSRGAPRKGMEDNFKTSGNSFPRRSFAPRKEEDTLPADLRSSSPVLWEFAR